MASTVPITGPTTGDDVLIGFTLEENSSPINLSTYTPQVLLMDQQGGNVWSTYTVDGGQVTVTSASSGQGQVLIPGADFEPSSAPYSPGMTATLASNAAISAWYAIQVISAGGSTITVVHGPITLAAL